MLEEDVEGEFVMMEDAEREFVMEEVGNEIGVVGNPVDNPDEPAKADEEELVRANEAG